MTEPVAAPFPTAMIRRAAAEVAPGGVAAVGPGTPPGLRDALATRGVTVVDAAARDGADGGPRPDQVDVLFVGPVQATPEALRLPAPTPVLRRNGVAPKGTASPGLASSAQRPIRTVAVFPQADPDPDGSGRLRMVRRLDDGGPRIRADVWITDLGVYAVGPDGAVLQELAPGCTARQAQEASELPLQADAGLDEVERPSPERLVPG